MKSIAKNLNWTPTGVQKITKKVWPPLAGAALAMAAATAHSHAVLEPNIALSGVNTRLAVRIGHGCQGSPTREVRVTLPAGFRGAKPMGKPGWSLRVERAPLDKPYTLHGREVKDDARTIVWTATAPEHFLPDAHFDEFVLRGTPATEGSLWFAVLQRCESGEWNWAERPASGTSTRGLRSPAALLDVLPSKAASDHVH